MKLKLILMQSQINRMEATQPETLERGFEISVSFKKRNITTSKKPQNNNNETL
jgi:hypothetical protein